jgi:hypothetical protein
MQLSEVSLKSANIFSSNYASYSEPTGIIKTADLPG